MAIAGRSLGRATRHADDRPVVLLAQPFDDVAPDDAKRADHDGLFVLGHAGSALCPATMVEEFRARWKSRLMAISSGCRDGRPYIRYARRHSEGSQWRPNRNMSTSRAWTWSRVRKISSMRST